MGVSASEVNPANLSRQVQAAKESLKRCLGSEAFLDIFYNKFLSVSDDIRNKFANTRFENQKIMLKASLHIMLMLARGDLKNTQTMQQLADVHGAKTLDIRPEYYHSWVESMLYAIQQTDPQYTPELGESWRQALQPGIDFMLSKYHQ